MNCLAGGGGGRCRLLLPFLITSDEAEKGNDASERGMSVRKRRGKGGKQNYFQYKTKREKKGRGGERTKKKKCERGAAFLEGAVRNGNPS
jgi:hypothetical protein